MSRRAPHGRMGRAPPPSPLGREEDDDRREKTPYLRLGPCAFMILRYWRHLDSCLEKGSTGGLGVSRLVHLYEDFLSIWFRCEMF
ncbi:hypothetical protein U9M48_025967 [Paspalum notatum var. saurae]|uniref:Uncharacterized protein n=1 Tax=Paspalum notatum var. saurae TaxID=547442 RepID=A0AAQ3TR77_PASNO